ncbi:MAG TPA: nuclear transport factor 2 family protein [Dokdonella sp.]|nr:nuclear transport factor 2 family protein [Dokdonella sp.]
MHQDQAQALWQLEEQFWTGPADFYEAHLAPEALMVLPPPAGVLDRAATIESIRTGARWRHVAFEQQRIAASGASTVVLAYVARADRGPPDTTYAAQCSSTYARSDGAWLLVMHHQTPAAR